MTYPNGRKLILILILVPDQWFKEGFGAKQDITIKKY
jgi:hypothetical protein